MAEAEPLEKEGLEVYPNANFGEMVLRLQLITDSEIQYEIFDLSGSSTKVAGKMRLGGGNQELKLDARDRLSAGLYILKVTSDNTIWTRKLLIK